MSTERQTRLRKGEFRDGSRLEDSTGGDLWGMPIYVQKRGDGERLWAAFRAFRGNAWTGRDVAAFVAGWDARNGRAS